MILTMLWASTSQAEKVKFCFLFCTVESDATDSFCAAYERVIRSPADAKTIKATPDPVRRWVERNEVLYKCTCQNWTNPICSTTKK